MMSPRVVDCSFGRIESVNFVVLLRPWHRDGTSILRATTV